ncbi:hypothetical protein M3Y94_01120300 [Aphelenchoides besseyi]|nr:hypothetical protein M3Y94_01120300 [Aphelenchoides besseyi]
MSEDAEKLNKLVVMPESVVDIEKTTPLDSVRAITSFVRAKTQESQKAVEATSAISFMANNLQNRQLVTEFSVSVAKFYNDLGVNSEAACRQKLEELAITDHEMAPLLKELTDAWKDWETFLEGIDRAVEEVVGSNSPKSISSADNIKVATKKGSVQQGTLLSYVQNSPFQLMLIEIVLSFTANNCADHVLKMYEKLAAFQALNCDILLLTKSSGGDGGGFLKLVGVPFKLLLDEEQSLARILQHRQSAVSIASQKIINLLAEISCTGATIDTDQTQTTGFDKNGGVIILDSAGNILYNYVNNDSKWPDVDVLLTEVEKNKKDDANSIKQTNGTLETGKETKETTVTVGKRRCCTIM